MPNTHYSVIVSGERFNLTRDQLESDPGNYFVTYFLGDFAESANGVNELVTEKEPLLFKLIQAHLRGYEILPLASTSIPTYMTMGTALNNLLEEAQFYGLERLVEKIKAFQLEERESQPKAVGTAIKQIVTPPVRRYLVQYRRGRTTWQSHEISEEQYKIYLNRYIHLQKTYTVPDPTAADGYATQATWLEVMSDDPKEPKVPCRSMIDFEDGNCSIEITSRPESGSWQLEPSHNDTTTRYVIVVSGERFTFTRDQIESDPGNYFATCFFGEFAEGKRETKEMAIEKDVQLFKLIQAHLRGYEIFPLPNSAIPHYMTRAGAITNLLLEAQYYGLERLEEKIRAVQSESAYGVTPTTVGRTYKFGRFRREGWVLNDINEEGYQLLLTKFQSNPGNQPVASTSLVCPPGYSLTVCWRAKERLETEYANIPGECLCALLVSDPSK